MRVILDVDTGCDDAHAIALALRSPELEVIAITCVAGNGPVDLVTNATLKTMEAWDAPNHIPVLKGCDCPLIEVQHPCPFIHGKDCLGDLNPPLPEPKRQAEETGAVVWLVEFLKKSPEKVSIISLAPLTNLAMAFKLNPQVMLSKIERLYWMGGAVRQGGNFGPWTEANAGYDPEAAHILLSSNIPVTMFPWDVYTSVEFHRDEVINFDPGLTTLSSRLLVRDMDNWGSCKAMIGDAVTVACIADPSLIIEASDFAVSVELSGLHTRGMTVVDQRGNVDPPDKPKGNINATVVTQVNPDKVKEIFAKRIWRDTFQFNEMEL